MSTVDVISHNAEAWDLHVKNAWQWTVPVSHEEIEAARAGLFSILLTAKKPVPREWFPEKLAGLKILCLASGGGQQAPILAAAGADVTVFDNSLAQLTQDRLVSQRENLPLKIVRGDMRDLSAFADGDDVSPWALDALAWASAAGIVEGTAPATLEPQGEAVRAQLAAMLARFCQTAAP